jgi:hypothetical protein
MDLKSKLIYIGIYALKYFLGSEFSRSKLFSKLETTMPS